MEDGASTTRSKRAPVTYWTSSAIPNRASHSGRRLQGTSSTDLFAVKDSFVSTAILLLRMHKPDTDHVAGRAAQCPAIRPWLASTRRLEAGKLEDVGDQECRPEHVFLSASQIAEMEQLRNLDGYACTGAYLFSQKIPTTVIENTDFLFRYRRIRLSSSEAKFQVKATTRRIG